jgi:dolichol-phosphate mannosyltransferase
MKVALRLQKIFKGKIRILKREGKLGLGSAYIDALKFVKSPYVVLMDADLSHHVSAPWFLRAVPSHTCLQQRS